MCLEDSAITNTPTSLMHTSLLHFLYVKVKKLVQAAVVHTVPFQMPNLHPSIHLQAMPLWFHPPPELCAFFLFLLRCDEIRAKTLNFTVHMIHSMWGVLALTSDDWKKSNAAERFLKLQYATCGNQVSCSIGLEIHLLMASNTLFAS